jgi:UPF0042 nucleotide-binding protein
MPTAIKSFGFRHGLTVDGHIVFAPDPSKLRNPVQVIGSALVIDVRRILPKNPYHDRKLRALRGDDREVIAELERTPGIEEAYNRLLHEHVEPFGGVVYVGCTGGHHRSVYIANRLGNDLKLPVEHLNYEDR